jgi:hypothetical protein
VNACSNRCGWCGACDDGVREQPELRDYLTCDHCGGDAFQPVTLAGIGIACSRACMDVLEAQYASDMAARERVRQGRPMVTRG